MRPLADVCLFFDQCNWLVVLEQWLYLLHPELACSQIISDEALLAYRIENLQASN